MNRSMIAILVTLFLIACDQGGMAPVENINQGDLPPVEDTRISGDTRILNDNGLMSDGSQVIPHETTTLNTSIQLTSLGAIGGISVDSIGNVYNSNFAYSV